MPIEGQVAITQPTVPPWPPWMHVRTSSPLDPGQAQRVLVIRTDHLGDLLLSTPFLDALRAALPRSEITALVTPYTRPALARNPSIDRLSDFDPKAASDEQQHTLEQLAAARYDAVIALAPTMPAYRLARATRAPVRAGYVYSRRWVPRALTNLMLTHRAIFHLDGLVERGEAVPHEVEQLAWFARSLGLPGDSTPLRLYPDLEDLGRLKAELERPAATRSEGGAGDTVARVDSGWLAVNLAAAWVKAPWSLEDYLDLLKGLLQTIPDAHLLVTCGPQEELWAAQLAEAFASQPRVRLLRGRSISEWGAALTACRMAVSSDTGAVHMAAATKTPVVACYEERTYHLCSQQWAPWMVVHRKVVKSTPFESIPRILVAAAELWKPGR